MSIFQAAPSAWRLSEPNWSNEHGEWKSAWRWQQAGDCLSMRWYRIAHVIVSGIGSFSSWTLLVAECCERLYCNMRCLMSKRRRPSHRHGNMRERCVDVGVEKCTIYCPMDSVRGLTTLIAQLCVGPRCNMRCSFSGGSIPATVSRVERGS